jgi:hypothetical protein
MRLALIQTLYAFGVVLTSLNIKSTDVASLVSSVS